MERSASSSSKRDVEDGLVDLRLGPFDRHGTARASFQGRWVEVEHGIPGELVRARIGGTRRLYGQIVEILEAAPDRVEPPCPYFRDWHCGGCQWQHITYASQLALKRSALEDALQQQGLDLRVTATHTLDDPWRYRSTVGISLGKSVGFRRHGSLAIAPVRDCLIARPPIGMLMAELNDLRDTSKLPDFRGRVRLDVRVAGQDDQPFLLVLVRADADRPPPANELELLVRALESATGVRGVSVLGESGEIVNVAGPLLAPVMVGDREFLLTAASFFQTNLKLLPDLIKRVHQATHPLQGKRVADAYAGVGVLGLFLALQAEEVSLIESDPQAIEAARLTADAWNLSNVNFIGREAEQALAHSGPYDVVIVDPPRSGLSPEALNAIVGRLPSLLLYVSCLPDSLARDLRVLIDSGYRLEELELFDFYPQTYHVESLAVLRAVA